MYTCFTYTLLFGLRSHQACCGRFEHTTCNLGVIKPVRRSGAEQWIQQPPLLALRSTKWDPDGWYGVCLTAPAGDSYTTARVVFRAASESDPSGAHSRRQSLGPPYDQSRPCHACAPTINPASASYGWPTQCKRPKDCTPIAL